MPDDKFKLPGSSYEEVVKVIKGYGHHTEPAELSSISQVTGLHPTIVSRNNGFLVGTGIIEGGQKKALTAVGRQLAHALDHEIEQDISSTWRELVLASDFFRKLLSAIRIRNGMETATLQSHIAYSAGLSKSPGVMTGARTVIEVLQVAGVIREVEGKLQTVNVDQISVPVSPDTREAGEKDNREFLLGSVLVPTFPASAPRPQRAPEGPDSRERPLLQVNIEVRVQCTPDELESLSPKLRALLDELTAPRSSTTSE